MTLKELVRQIFQEQTINSRNISFPSKKNNKIDAYYKFDYKSSWPLLDVMYSFVSLYESDNDMNTNTIQLKEIARRLYVTWDDANSALENNVRNIVREIAKAVTYRANNLYASLRLKKNHSWSGNPFRELELHSHDMIDVIAKKHFPSVDAFLFHDLYVFNNRMYNRERKAEMKNFFSSYKRKHSETISSVNYHDKTQIKIKRRKIDSPSHQPLLQTELDAVAALSSLKTRVQPSVANQAATLFGSRVSVRRREAAEIDREAHILLDLKGVKRTY